LNLLEGGLDVMEMERSFLVCRSRSVVVRPYRLVAVHGVGGSRRAARCGGAPGRGGA
jgi:hypothetical protein